MGTGAMGRAMPPILPGANEEAAVVPTTAAAAAGVVGSWTGVVSIGTADTNRGAAVAATAELERATLPVTESAITCLIGSPRKEGPAHFEHIYAIKTLGTSSRHGKLISPKPSKEFDPTIPKILTF